MRPCVSSQGKGEESSKGVLSEKRPIRNRAGTGAEGAENHKGGKKITMTEGQLGGGNRRTALGCKNPWNRRGS